MKGIILLSIINLIKKIIIWERHEKKYSSTSMLYMSEK